MATSFPNDNEFIREVLFATPDNLVVIDHEGRIVLVNEQALDTFGFRRDELLGQRIEILIPPRYRHDHPQRRAEYLEAPSMRTMGLWRSLTAINKRGIEIPVEVSLNTVSTKTGRYVLAAIRNVSEQRWMESVIQCSNITLARIASGTPLEEVLTAIIAFIEQSCVNVRVCIVRCEAEENRLLVESVSTLSPRCCAALQNLDVNTRQGMWSEAAFHGERICITDICEKFFGPRHLDLVAEGIRGCWSEPIKDGKGNVLGAMVMFCEEPREPQAREVEAIHLFAHMVGIVMERDLRQRQLLEQEERLRHKHKLEAVGSLTGGIAHEFNNLLQTISAYTDFAIESVDPSEQALQDLVTVRCATQRATSLTRQLLSFCRQHPINRRRIDLTGLVNETINLVQPLLGENIKLVFEQDSAPALSEVIGDFGQLQQTLINLCINSRDAMPDGGRMRICTVAVEQIPGRPSPENRHGWVMLSVQDTGCGMTREVKDRIFEPFFTTKELGKGTGLGLPMVYGVVQQHDGVLEVDSTPQGGTTFRIYLPTTESIGSPPAECELFEVPKTNLLKGGSETILLAEDEQSVREALERMLKEAGYAVVSAETGEDAVRLFATHRDSVALVMLDVVMPGHGGRWAAAQIKELSPETPLILCTGYDPTASGGREDFGDLSTIIKPVDRKQLLAMVQDQLSSRQKP